ncbi:MAG: L,D-transpeptidase family protein [Halomonas sp.]|nr:L,D-transpeptidase family protein [Halomonas sp.]
MRRAIQFRLRHWLALGLLALPRLLLAQEGWPTGHYPLPEQGDIVGRIQTVEADQEDTLIGIGLDHGVGYNAIRLANPDTRVWLPGAGTQVTLPTRYILPPGPREGIVVNLAEMRLYYYPQSGQGETPRVESYPIGIGRMDWQTPLGTTQVTTKLVNPAWYPPDSIIQERAARGEHLPQVVPPGPDNPLGKHAMMLDIPGYLIHGTNRPQGVGMRVSHGCIRMLPDDIAALVQRVPKGTQVRLIDEPVKLGWTHQGTLQVQAYPIPETTPEEMAKRVDAAFAAATEAANKRGFLVDYARLKAIVEDPNGMPQPLLLAGAPIEIPYHFYDQIPVDPVLYSLVDANQAATTEE